MHTLNRDLRYQVSTTYLEKKASYFIGGLLILASIGMSLPLFFISSGEISQEIPPFVLYIIIGVFATAGWFFIAPYAIDRVRPKQPLVFDPSRKGRKMIFNLLIATVFVGAFLSVFHIITLDKDVDEVIYLLYFFDAMMAIMLLVKFFSAFKLLVQAQKFGKSRIELLDGPSYGLGDQVSFHVFNERLVQAGGELEISLRNIQETWDVGGSKQKQGKNSNGLVTEVMHEEVQTASILPGSEPIRFNLPDFGYETRYANPNPIYWEIMTVNEEIGFEARFFIELN